MGNLPALLGLWQDGGRGVSPVLSALADLHPGKGKQGRNHPEKGLYGPYQELSTGHICPESQSLWLRGSSGPCSPMDSVLWADIASWQGPCWNGLDESPGENHWGKGSRTPTWPPCSAQLCLLLKPGPPCRGAGLCQGPRYALGSA